ncbi:hypothetical protein Pla86_53050 (plasmid) [Planctomycetes bacterium Pla86]|uniref:Uncharacterized protein n=1 Tax=Engelhardtia mirabilis TaxID=2528011 RepID=A0A518BT86_9BACT|nr:hypothetical protein Pla133_53030 [Planctomycetes bacterium Pla133]QDV04509.1 hypothetical protein Pla86_53050 [Planctomycetes bacterium Pla86]
MYIIALLVALAQGPAQSTEAADHSLGQALAQAVVSPLQALPREYQLIESVRSLALPANAGGRPLPFDPTHAIGAMSVSTDSSALIEAYFEEQLGRPNSRAISNHTTQLLVCGSGVSLQLGFAEGEVVQELAVRPPFALVTADSGRQVSLLPSPAITAASLSRTIQPLNLQSDFLLWLGSLPWDVTATDEPRSHYRIEAKTNKGLSHWIIDLALEPPRILAVEARAESGLTLGSIWHYGDHQGNSTEQAKPVTASILPNSILNYSFVPNAENVVHLRDIEEFVAAADLYSEPYIAALPVLALYPETVVADLRHQSPSVYRPGGDPSVLPDALHEFFCHRESTQHTPWSRASFLRVPREPSLGD